MIIGQKLRKLREDNGLLLRQIAAELEVDTAYVSKMERGEKNIKREFIIKLASIYNINSDELITLWLANQINEIIKFEEMGLDAVNYIKVFIENSNSHTLK
ncbi:helix-turn-helix domain-containing protein [Halosquirtibacter laminarini]|uniref:Helix-turn-helix domain-containing protein n=1 Tax=Halosquirtibacter laminarini TaxID=3374600 RepID=A0AC61NPH6_9BACT|nr:helix-turn-helix domain-containing protein [Prolixibacteraceae bacterium]